MSDTRQGRTYEIVLWGATGFTGKLTAEYLARHAPEDLRWAIAGRNRQKLEATRAELAAIAPRFAELPILEGDSHDRASLARIASETAVVCTTVGPYMTYGKTLVEVCAEAGTSYCDLTGETPFIREMLDLHHTAAKSTGARIVHCCGYDSIPSDLGTFMMQEAAIERFGRPCRVVKNYIGRTKGGLSGGTAASMLTIMEAAQDKAVRRVLGHPYGLNPKGERKGPDGSDPKGVSYDPEIPCFTAPFVMAAINTRVVRRTNALLEFRYGRAFEYVEKMMLPYSPKGLALATGISAGITGMVVGLAVPPIRNLIRERYLPAPGEGPSREERERGYFNHHLFGSVETKDGAAAFLRGKVVGVNDPGYGETAKMLSESALCLARDPLTSEGGVLTPAVAMGPQLLERLRRAGMTFEIR